MADANNRAGEKHLPHRADAVPSLPLLTHLGANQCHRVVNALMAFPSGQLGRLKMLVWPMPNDEHGELVDSPCLAPLGTVAQAIANVGRELL